MIPRTPLAILADVLGNADNDPMVKRCLGLILSGALILAWAALKITKGA